MGVPQISPFPHPPQFLKNHPVSILKIQLTPRDTDSAALGRTNVSFLRDPDN